MFHFQGTACRRLHVVLRSVCSSPGFWWLGCRVQRVVLEQPATALLKAHAAPERRRVCVHINVAHGSPNGYLGQAPCTGSEQAARTALATADRPGAATSAVLETSLQLPQP